MTSVRVRVPGKILLTGEYAVLDGAPAIVAAVDRFVEAEAAPAYEFQLRGMGLCWRASGPEVEGLSFARQALRVVQRYLDGRRRALPPLAFELRDELRAPDGQKLGLGGSACVCVAIVSTALAVAETLDAGLRTSSRAARRDRIFKLAALAHGRAQKKLGSGVDVAASTFGGLVSTRRFDMAPFVRAFEAPSAEAFAEAIDRSPAHAVEQLPAPGPLLLLFSGKSASTPTHIAAVRQAAELHPAAWQRFLRASADATQCLAQASRERDMAACLTAIERAANALSDFEPLTGIEITTPEHRSLMSLAQARGVRAKPSGAGGGDCAFAIGTQRQLEALERELTNSGGLCFQVGICRESD
ncbi:MAG: hypothetical protein LBM75_11795 [Myxococcales bacterium]|nr:hypothetical protein [Myxococcales bacterium]